MYHFKLLGLVLSTLLTVTPVNYRYEIEFPFTRTDKVAYRITYEVYDLGEISIGGLYHDYDVIFNIDVYCSSSCNYGSSEGFALQSHNINSNTLTLRYRTLQRNKSPEDLATLLSSVSSNSTSESVNTYASQNTLGRVTFSVTLTSALNIIIVFPAVTNQMLLNDIDYVLDDFKTDYELVNKRRLIYQLVLDKDVDAEYQRRVLQLLNQNDVDAAYNLVTNYYNTYSVSDTEHNETVVNNYTTKQTDLNTYFNTENNFANQIESDFTDQNDDIPLSDTAFQFQNSNFVKSAEWVTLRFNDLFQYSPYGKLLSFSLITGLILALIGRFKR